MHQALLLHTMSQHQRGKKAQSPCDVPHTKVSDQAADEDVHDEDASALSNRQVIEPIQLDNILATCDGA
jgi:hypothetical protein